jgi:hypothetical protein
MEVKWTKPQSCLVWYLEQLPVAVGSFPKQHGVTLSQEGGQNWGKRATKWLESVR